MDNKVIIEEHPMTPEFKLMFEKAKKNLDWFEANCIKLDVFNRYRGKYVASSEGELFVADTAEEVRELAREKHPDDLPHIRYIPREKVPRIYAC
jgi:hypothetical protein